MSISIAASDIKRKAMVPTSNTQHDTSINSLITEMQAPLEYSISSEYIISSDSGLLATLKLGMLEIITGEFLEQLKRETGNTEAFAVAGITIGASAVQGIDLINQGYKRLTPFLKDSSPLSDDSGILSSSVDVELEFSVE